MNNPNEVEEWREVVAHKTKLEVSSLGRVRDMEGKYVKIIPGSDEAYGGKLLYPEAYPRITLNSSGSSTKPTLVKTLVARAFCTVMGEVVVHKNKDHLDLRASNITRCKRWQAGQLGKVDPGEHYRLLEINVLKVNQVRRLRDKGISFIDIAVNLDLAPGTVRSIVEDTDRQFVHEATTGRGSLPDDSYMQF